MQWRSLQKGRKGGEVKRVGRNPMQKGRVVILRGVVVMGVEERPRLGRRHAETAKNQTFGTEALSERGGEFCTREHLVERGIAGNPRAQRKALKKCWRGVNEQETGLSGGKRNTSLHRSAHSVRWGGGGRGAGNGLSRFQQAKPKRGGRLKKGGEPTFGQKGRPEKRRWRTIFWKKFQKVGPNKRLSTLKGEYEEGNRRTLAGEGMFHT